MNVSELVNEIQAVYRKHGWQLRRLLLKPTTRAQLDLNILDDAPFEEATIDAIWFSRASHNAREAWELRLISDQPYAIFETFEKDETEEQRSEMRSEMEARMRDYITRL